MQLRRCNACRVRVIPTSENKCPNCGGPVDTSEFVPVEAVRKPQPPPARRGPIPWYLFVPALFLCLISLMNFFYSAGKALEDKRPARPVIQDPVLAKVATYLWKMEDFVSTAPAVAMYLLGFLGSGAMLLRRGWLLAFLSSIIAMLPLTGMFCLGLPVGMLCLILILVPHVHVQFRQPD